MALCLLGLFWATANAQSEVLKVGDKAPGFEVETLAGATFKLSDHFGEDSKPVVLVFSRANWWPYCMKQLGELQKNGAQQFKELGVEVVAVFREEREGIAGLKKIKNRTKVDFTLALDTPANATKAYSNGRKDFDNYLVDGTGCLLYTSDAADE